MKQYPNKSVPSRKSNLSKGIATPALAVALLLTIGSPVHADSTPAPTSTVTTSTQVTSPLAVAVNAAMIVANDARMKVSLAEKASKASPTDDALKAALATARANAQTAFDALKAARDAYVADAKKNVTADQAAFVAAQAKLKDARSALETLRNKLQPEFKAALDAAIAKAKMDVNVTPTPTSGVTTPDVKAVVDAKALFTSTYLALGDARAKVSVAEKASHANPSDAGLVTALSDARNVANVANDAFNSARNALAKLVGDNGQPRHEVKIDTKALFASVQASFLVTHPEIAVAQKAVSDAEAAVKALQITLNAEKDATGDLGNKGIDGKGGIAGNNGKNGDHHPASPGTVIAPPLGFNFGAQGGVKGHDNHGAPTPPTKENHDNHGTAGNQDNHNGEVETQTLLSPTPEPMPTISK